jgi:assimilatory nitrate reductase catalytic subunit
VVLQEAYRNTDTAAYADILLPASTWGEKEGTVTNSERRISRVRAAVAPPGEARADWEILTDFARRLGGKLGDVRADRLFPYRKAEDVFDEHRESTRGRDLDITGLSYARLEAEGPQQWPLAEGDAGGAPRLYTDGRFATGDGRARFVEVRHQDTAERTDARYPLHLTTGRLRDQWHGMSRTGTVARLFNHSPEPYAGMHRDDMARCGLKDGDLVQLKSRRGKLTLRVQGSDELRPAQVFVPMHWGSQFMHGAGVNTLTASDFDPHSKQPELKHAAVQADKVELPHTLVAMCRFAADAIPSAQQLAERLQPLLAKFDYASVNLVGREHAVVVFRAYSAAPPDPASLRELDRLLTLDAPESTMHYRDLRRGVFKAARVERDAVVAVRLVGETAGEEWLKNMMVQGASAEAVRPWVLAPVSTAPRGTLNRGRIVCNCLDVSETEIRRELLPGVTLEELQARLRCGTECGSCLPELKRMRAAQEQLAAAESAI